MRLDLPRPLACPLDSVRATIMAAGVCDAKAAGASAHLGYLLTLVHVSPAIHAAAARMLAACLDLDEEVEVRSRCRVPPAFSVENARSAALWALQEFTATLEGVAPSSEAYHLGLAWAFRYAGDSRRSAVTADAQNSNYGRSPMPSRNDMTPPAAPYTYAIVTGENRTSDDLLETRLS
jgi:hypothetical protein